MKEHLLQKILEPERTKFTNKWTQYEEMCVLINLLI